MNEELLKRAQRLAIDFGHRGNADAAGTIRDLLAEVEAQRKRGDEVIAVLRCLRDVCTTPGETKADFVERIKAVLGADPDARVESLYAAEARLLALCEAEPVERLVGKLRAAVTDYDGAQMADSEPPKDGLTCLDLRRAVDAIDRQTLNDFAALQFLTDVVTAAGLLAYGKTDKHLAQRISDGAYALRVLILPPNKEVPRG